MIRTASIGLLNIHGEFHRDYADLQHNHHHLQLAASLKPAQVTVCGGRTRLASGPASSRSILDTGYCRTAAEHVTTWFIIVCLCLKGFCR